MAKKMRKVLSLVLALSMVMSLLSVVASAEGSRFSCDCETRHIHGAECYEEKITCTTEKDLTCEKTEHSHKEECFVEHICGEACDAETCAIEKDRVCDFAEEYAHTDACYVAHVHDESCPRESVLTCTESVYHVHGAACYEKIDGKAWMTRGTFRTHCVEPVCEYADMKIHGHEYSCLTEAAKAEILVSYPESNYVLDRDYSDPYVFSEIQTYLPSGYYYHLPKENDDSHPQLWMMADVQGLKEGDSWSHNLKSDSSPVDRFAVGESNFAVAYCCDRDTSVVRYTAYRQINLEDANYYDNITAQKIRSVMMNSYPYISVEKMQANLAAAGFADAYEVDEGAMIAAAQIAVWKYANTNTLKDIHYWYTVASGKYPVLTAHWEAGGKDSFRISGSGRGKDSCISFGRDCEGFNF